MANVGLGQVVSPDRELPRAEPHHLETPGAWSAPIFHFVWSYLMSSQTLMLKYFLKPLHHLNKMLPALLHWFSWVQVRSWCKARGLLLLNPPAFVSNHFSWLLRLPQLVNGADGHFGRK